MTSTLFFGYSAALAMGLALGLTGGGGSILTVPILVYIFGIGALEATIYSLGIVGLVAAWGALGAFRNKDLHLSRALSFGIPGVLGVLTSRRIFLPMLPDQISAFGLLLNRNSILLILFSFLMLAASISMIRSSRIVEPKGSKRGVNLKVSNGSLFFGGLTVGILAGFVGAGGGFLIVPALVNFGKLDIKQAIGTSLFVIALQSLLGVLGDFETLTKIDHTLFVLIVVLALIGMSIGTRFRKHIPAAKLKLGFGIFVLVMGSLILIQELKKGSL